MIKVDLVEHRLAPTSKCQSKYSVAFTVHTLTVKLLGLQRLFPTQVNADVFCDVSIVFVNKIEVIVTNDTNRLV